MTTNRNVGDAGRVLRLIRPAVAPAPRRYAELALERATERFLGRIAGRVREPADRLSALAQAQSGGLQAPDGEVTDGRHADEAGEAVHEGAARQPDLARE